jgi:hypothetical protein
MFNALSLSIIITIVIGIYLYSFIHKDAYQSKVLTTANLSLNEDGQQSKFKKENPFLLAFDTIL